MTSTEPESAERPTVVCPHCGRDFRGELLLGPGDEPQGFKCPHCRLFVAADRAEQPAA